MLGELEKAIGLSAIALFQSNQRTAMPSHGSALFSPTIHTYFLSPESLLIYNDYFTERHHILLPYLLLASHRECRSSVLAAESLRLGPPDHE